MAPIHLLPNYSLMLCLPRSTINDTAPMEHVVCCLRCLLRMGLRDSFVFLLLSGRISLVRNTACGSNKDIARQGGFQNGCLDLVREIGMTFKAESVLPDRLGV